MINQTQQPAALCFNALDATGAGGISANIETMASLGCHCCPITTALLGGDTRQLSPLAEIDSTLLIQHSRAILEDIQIQALLLGHIHSIEQAEVIHSLLVDYPHLPVMLNVCQPWQSEAPMLTAALQELIVPFCDVLLINHKQLIKSQASGDTVAAKAQGWLQGQDSYLLCTDAAHQQLQLYQATGLARQFENKLCQHPDTLASAVCAFLAHGDNVPDACTMGIKYWQQTLAAPIRLGMGEPHNNRLFWVDQRSKQ